MQMPAPQSYVESGFRRTIRLVASGVSRTVLLIAALMLSAGIASAADITWTVDGVERSAIIYAPKSPLPGKLPLILSFHGPPMLRYQR